MSNSLPTDLGGCVQDAIDALAKLANQAAEWGYRDLSNVALGGSEELRETVASIGANDWLALPVRARQANALSVALVYLATRIRALYGEAAQCSFTPTAVALNQAGGKLAEAIGYLPTRP